MQAGSLGTANITREVPVAPAAPGGQPVLWASAATQCPLARRPETPVDGAWAQDLLRTARFGETGQGVPWMKRTKSSH